jgi:hypothetical protein
VPRTAPIIFLIIILETADLRIRLCFLDHGFATIEDRLGYFWAHGESSSKFGGQMYEPWSYEGR